MSTCSKHVWDNGDTTDCGAPVVAHGLCSFHLADQRGYLLERIGQLTRALNDAHGELQAVLTDVTKRPSFQDRFKVATVDLFPVALEVAAEAWLQELNIAELYVNGNANAAALANVLQRWLATRGKGPLCGM